MSQSGQKSQSQQRKLQLRQHRLAKLAQIQDDASDQSRSRSRSGDKKQRQNPDTIQHSRMPNKETSLSKPQHAEQEPQHAQDDIAEAEGYPEEDEMQKLMGFSSFSTTKNKDHSKTNCQAVFKNSKARRQYRQYMNRRGGFDRNLDKI